ncbi:unnamed protein product [Ilex paraguariensis]|uniref:C3HC-type domain-containing protein n=1 Tax=Ilex paraguariensis TaxID=185542 RepID=A0ABC8RSE0_9AQUA
MAEEESEKRFHAIMDKLFHSPTKSITKSTPSSSTPSSSASTRMSGVELTRGKKRHNMSSALAVMEPKAKRFVVEELPNNSSGSSGSVQAPPCRPWDRGDLLKRLASFKSMTWFAKPQVVSAVNCARRGWINVEMDIIACEACGARLLFSTPSSWTQQQVEKAALVFSLKLDNGHKLLCPWVDNACDETLAQFPPTQSADLVENYQRRCSALLQLFALPMISSSAIDYMRSPLLENFLGVSSTLEYGNKSVDVSRIEGNEFEEASSILYYQAQKLISLCGWEPRSLPYIVDLKDLQDQSTNNVNPSELSLDNSNGKNVSLNIYSSGTDEIMETTNNPMVSARVQCDPNSAVLDCRLCAATVGLWAFSKLPWPVEFLRLVGYSEVNGESDAVHHMEDEHNSSNRNMECLVNMAKTGTTSLNDRPANLNLTIAGGPPPTKQNFRATISLPVIGQVLRARLSTDSDSLDHLCRKVQGSSDHTGKTLIATSTPDSMLENPIEKIQKVTQGSKLPDNAENDVLGNSAECCFQVGDSSITTGEAHTPIGNVLPSDNDTLMKGAAEACFLQQNADTGTLCSKQDGSAVEAMVQPVNHNVVPMVQSVSANWKGFCIIFPSFSRYKEGAYCLVVSAVNCARRGWINVEMDIIACEACGARLLFSTPSSWTQQQGMSCFFPPSLLPMQFEKAALVFSLKLDNGHKLLCPWVDNACDETLAQFPPTQSADLVENYQRRCSALLQLFALPMISSSAIDYMRSPLLENFLGVSSTLEYGNKSVDVSRIEGNEFEEASSILYYQAQKLISLCGWEPRSLPYIVDLKDLQDQSTNNVNPSELSLDNSNGKNVSLNIYSSGTDEIMETTNNPMVSARVQCDPNSAVLDCRLCAATVGLWAFSKLPWPVEFLRLVGYSEVNGESDAVHHMEDEHNSSNRNMECLVNMAKTGTTSLNDRPANLNLTIAGGPPPTKQNFRATISLPVIGQVLRARLSTDSDSLDHLCRKVQGSSDHTGKTLIATSTPDSMLENPIEKIQKVTQGSKLPDNAENDVLGNSAECCFQVGDSSITTGEAHTPIGNVLPSDNDTLMKGAAEACFLQQNADTGTLCSKQDGSAVEAMVQPVNHNVVPMGKDLQQPPLAKSMEFDPIRQHRHFCPWIVSSGNSAPGWQQTLSALYRHKECSRSLSTDAPSSSLIEVDDPIASIKKLFMSPAERTKRAHGSH